MKIKTSYRCPLWTAPVTVTYEGPDVPDREQCPLLGEFLTLRGAEAFIALLAESDPDGAYAGYYGINVKNKSCRCLVGPEWSGSLNPNEPDDEWICDDCGRVWSCGPDAVSSA